MATVKASRRGLALMVVAALASATVACGGQNTSPHNSASPSAPSVPAPTPQGSGSASPPTSSRAEDSSRCHTPNLQASLPFPPDAATGNVGQRLQLINTGTVPCTVNGYPGYGLLDQDHQGLPTDVARGSNFFTVDPGARPVLLAPGQRAYAYFAWEQVPAQGKPCERSAFVAITAPNETAPLTVAFTGRFCGGGHLTTTALSMSPPTGHSP